MVILVEHLSLLIGAVIVPICGFAINILGRKMCHLPQSCGSDLLLLLLIFDAAVLIDHDKFESFVRYKGVHDQFVPIYDIPFVTSKVA